MSHQKSFQDCNQHFSIPLGCTNEFDEEKSLQNQIPGLQLLKPFFKAVARKAITEVSPVKRSLATAVGSVKAIV